MFFLFHSALAEVERHVVPVAVLLYRLLPDHINGLGGGEAGAGRRSPVRREVGEVQARVTGPDADTVMEIFTGKSVGFTSPLWSWEKNPLHQDRNHS